MKYTNYSGQAGVLYFASAVLAHVQAPSALRDHVMVLAVPVVKAVEAAWPKVATIVAVPAVPLIVTCGTPVLAGSVELVWLAPVRMLEPVACGSHAGASPTVRRPLFMQSSTAVLIAPASETTRETCDLVT